MPYKTITLYEKPHLAEEIDRMSVEAWPTFLLNADTPKWRYSLFEIFTDFQLLLCDSADRPVAIGHTIPFIWDGTNDNLPATLSEVLERALDCHRRKATPTTLSALAVIVAQDCQRQGLSSKMIQAMTSVASERQLCNFLAPVRPILKTRYPLISMDRYVHWKRSDGSAFDPWLRVHFRLGAESLRIARRAMTVKGTVDQWQEWTEMRFPESGNYVVPGALQPIAIDCENDAGRYDDPNLWMRHSIR